MRMSLSGTDRLSPRQLVTAINRGNIDQIRLPAGRLTLSGTAITSEIELIGVPGTRLAGPLRFVGSAKVRLVGIAIEGGVSVDDFAVLHLVECRVTGDGAPVALSLSGLSRLRVGRGLIDGGAGIAIGAGDQAVGEIYNSRLAGGRAARATGDQAQLTLTACEEIGPVLSGYRNDGPRPHGAARPGSGLFAKAAALFGR